MIVMGKRLWESYCCGKMVVIEKWLLWESDCYGKSLLLEIGFYGKVVIMGNCLL